MILFISHDASRTGAPIALLRLLDYLKRNSDLKFEILLKRGGPLEPMFRELAPTYVLHKGLISRILRRLAPARLNKIRLPRFLLKKKFSLVYSNTITNGELMNALKPISAPFLTHCHEMESEIRRNGYQNFDMVKRLTTRFIACSEAVCHQLESRGIDTQQIKVIPAPIEPKRIEIESRETIRSRLGLAQNDFLVCAGGTGAWRKGRDLFVQLAVMIESRRPPTGSIHFLWLGPECDSESKLWMEMMAFYGNVEAKLHWVGSVTNPVDYMRASDVFVMLSREDPTPLISIEAASVGLPIICFESAGGTADWVAKADCGRVVRYLDVNAAATIIVEFFKNDKLRNALGSRGSAYCQQYFSVETVGHQVETVLKEILANYSAR